MNVVTLSQSPHFLPLQPHKVQWANAVIKNALKTKDTIQLAEGWYLYGKIYEASGDYLTARRYFLRSLKIQEKRGDSFELARLYTRFAKIENDTHHYIEALRYTQLSLGVAKRIGSDRALLRAYGELVRIHATDWTIYKANTKSPKPNYDSVLYYLKKEEFLVQRSNDSLEIAAVDKSLGEELLRRKDPKAIRYFQRALNVFIQQNNQVNRIGPILNLAKATIAFGQTKRGYQLLRQAQVIYDSLPINDHMAKLDFEKVYVQYYHAIGDSKMELAHTNKLHELEKMELNSNREGAISRLSVEYETEQKEAELKAKQLELQLSQQNQQTQQRFVQILVVLLVGALGISIAFYRISVKNQRLSESNALLVREQNHRVKNNLQLVSSLLNLQLNRLTDDATKNVLEETQLRIEVMSVLQRTLYTGQTLGEVNVHDFLTEIVKVGLQTFDYEHVQVQTNISHSLHLPIDHAMRIGLIVNELLTNACKYAFPDHEAPQWSLSCEQSNRHWTLQVADNGPGFIPEKPISKKSSFGMRLIQLQADQLYAKYVFEIQEGSLFRLNFKV